MVTFKNVILNNSCKKFYEDTVVVKSLHNPCRICKCFNYFTKIRGITQNLFYFFSTVPSKIFCIKEVYI